MKSTSQWFGNFLMILRMISKTLAVLKFVEEPKTWNEAKDYCKTADGTLATIRNSNREEASKLVVNKNINSVWNGLFTIHSPWIENYGCYQILNSSSLGGRKQQLQSIKSENCQKFCNNEKYFGLMKGVCYCLGTDISFLQQTEPKSCLKCEDNKFNYCGGSGDGGKQFISVYKTIRIQQKRILGKDKYFCLAVTCIRSNSRQLQYYTNACNAFHNVICKNNHSHTQYFPWDRGLQECIKDGSFPITYNTYQAFCNDQTLISTAWTGAFRQVITTDMESRPYMVPLNCYSAKVIGELLQDSQAIENCQNSRSFFCKVSNLEVDEITTNLTPVDKIPDVTSYATTKNEITSSSAPDENEQNSVSNSYVGYVIGAVVGSICIIVTVIISVICMKQRRKAMERSNAVNDDSHQNNRQTEQLSYETLRQLESVPTPTYTSLDNTSSEQIVDDDGYLSPTDLTQSVLNSDVGVSEQQRNNYERLNHGSSRDESAYNSLYVYADVQ